MTSILFDHIDHSEKAIFADFSPKPKGTPSEYFIITVYSKLRSKGPPLGFLQLVCLFPKKK